MWILWLTVLGCEDPAGTPCELSSGMLGFGFSDDCQGRCLALTTVICPDGSEVRRAVCSGREDCTMGRCAAGEACYAVPDPFEEETFCAPEGICGALDPAAIQAWERHSHANARDVREEWAKKRRARVDKTSPPITKPVEQPATP